MSTLSDGSIVVDRVWKRFRKDQVRPLITDQLRALTRRGGREDRHRWVLRDIDFAVEPGESVAVVGANGAGKSTLLKLLCRVTYPYAGSVAIHGRVGAIIELRGGMHPELTGRENTFLYGALLGLSNQETAARFDTIVDFADLSLAIDRPLKFYSSGMQMRLGFAIAAFLRPHILLVDEVLAVGDAWFQQRCLDRMRDVLQEGTTLILVSHDLASVEAMCRRGTVARERVAGRRWADPGGALDVQAHGGRSCQRDVRGSRLGGDPGVDRGRRPGRRDAVGSPRPHRARGGERQ